ncbi:putative 28S rRNA (cytosine-C(5))-methyltransferase [Borealophlyctis nickersoniae]|nr:putative 28S rRNA (cytosine-C(5))-methyltransferase [Borealophlyctis nickersoniae]
MSSTNLFGDSHKHEPQSHPPRGLRPYFSDISLAPTGASASQFKTHTEHQKPITSAASDSALLQHQKSHPLFDDLNDPQPHTYGELLLAADTLEDIVTEGVFVGANVRRFRGFGHREEEHGSKDVMTDRVLKLVYGTMKYLPYIDTILVKTQFLVYNNQFLNHLGLTKVMLYDLMKCHFDYHRYPGILYDRPPNVPEEDKHETERADTVRELDEAVRAFQIKLSAAYARIRIERRASGDSTVEQMENILPEEVRAREHIAVEMPKCLRVNLPKVTREFVVEELRHMGYPVEYAPPKMDNRAARTDKPAIYFDPDFDNLLVVPSEYFSEIKGSKIVTEGRLIFQDKASCWGPQHLKPLLTDTTQIIDARAGCGTKTLLLSSMMRNKGRIFGFESRPSRLESLRAHVQVQGCTNVDIVEGDFTGVDPADPRYAEVSIVVIEPPNSGTSILDKLGYLLQEEEFPNEMYSQKDLISLKRQQMNIVKHAFSCNVPPPLDSHNTLLTKTPLLIPLLAAAVPSVETVMYITRSTHSEENEQVVEEVLDSVGGKWELSVVLPDVAVQRMADYEFEECFKIPASETTGNGIFVACFHRTPPTPKDPTPTSSEAGDDDLAARLSETHLHGGGHTKPTRKKRRDSTKRRKSYRGSVDANGKPKWAPPPLSKALSESVMRLAAPRGSRGSVTNLVATSAETHVRKSRTRLNGGGDTAAEDEGGDVTGQSEEQTGEGGGQRRRGSRSGEEVEVDLGVFGQSLKSFYKPREIAMRSIKDPAVLTMPKWIYPVPNPRPWK